MRAVAMLLGLMSISGSVAAADFMGLWLTPDQRGERLLARERFVEAAEAFEDPARRAAAYYRGGDFERAAAVWGSLSTPEAAYNRGNALVFLGRYEEAIASYDRALSGRSDWPEARANREVARLRLERLQPPEDDAGGTGGMLGADEIRFDDTGRVDQAGSPAEAEEQQAMGEDAMRAVWLRRVADRPADFLKARFSYQLYRDQQEAGDEPSQD